MQMTRIALVLACSGMAATAAMAGPRNPGANTKSPRAQKHPQIRGIAQNQPQLLEWVKVRKFPDGRVIPTGPITQYVAPSGHTDDPTLDAFDIFQSDAAGAPVGGECTGGTPPDPSGRWWFGPTYLNPHCLNDFSMDPAANGKPIDRIDFAWSWGVGGIRPMWVGIFIDDTFNTCAVGLPPSSGPVDGIALHFADDPGGTGYYTTNVGFPPPDPVAALGAPADGNGAYEVLLGNFDGVATWTFDTTPGTQPMLWGKNDPGLPGTQGSNQWDDDTPLDNLWVAEECYDYTFAVVCPADGLIAPMIAFWVDPAGTGGGCYANCDESTGTPLLTANDFQCFLNRYASGNTYANCDGSTGTPALTANDFQCFLNKYASGCT